MKKITEQTTTSTPTMKQLVDNMSCKFTTGLNPTNNNYWIALATKDNLTNSTKVYKNDYYVVDDKVEMVDGIPTGSFGLYRNNRFVPGTYNEKLGFGLLKWSCPEYKVQTNLSSSSGLSEAQLTYIKNSRYTTDGYTVNRFDGCKIEPYDAKICDRVDLNKINANLFPVPEKFYLYKSKTSINQQQSEEQRRIIEAYTNQSGCTTTAPLASEINQYYKVNLSQIPQYRKLFDSNFVIYCPYSGITKGNRTDYISGIKTKLNMSSVTDDCQFAMTVIYDGIYKRKNQAGRILTEPEITYLKNVLKQCATARDERGRTFNFRYKNNYQELVRLNKDNPASLAESKTKDLTTIIREQLVEAYNRKNRRY